MWDKSAWAVDAWAVGTWEGMEVEQPSYGGWFQLDSTWKRTRKWIEEEIDEVVAEAVQEPIEAIKRARKVSRQLMSMRSDAELAAEEIRLKIYREGLEYRDDLKQREQIAAQVREMEAQLRAAEQQAEYAMQMIIELDVVFVTMMLASQC